jgi:hypothetical protein
MDRRIVAEHHPMATVSARSAAAGSARQRGQRRGSRRPDLALVVSVVGLILGVVVLIRLLSAIAPGPPSLFAAPAAPSPTPPVRTHPTEPSATASTYISGTGVVTRGVAYSPLSVAQTSAIALPGSTVHGHLLVVKLLLRGVSVTPSTASVGLVDLVDRGIDYRPLLTVATALSHTLWQTLVLRRLAPGATKRVKLVFAVPSATQTDLELRVGSHAPGAVRLAIPVAPGAAAV